jgi:hypothetical protein
MRRPTLTTFALIVFWAVYAIPTAWMLYRGVSPVGRDLLLILVSYSLVVAAVAGALALGRRFVRLRGARSGRANHQALPSTSAAAGHQ